MDQTYHIVGGNGQTYGPVSLDKMLAWVREGRVVADTYVFRGDQADWLHATQFAELGLAAQQAALTPASAPVRVVATGQSQPVVVATPAPIQPVASTPAHPVATPQAVGGSRAVTSPQAEALVPAIKSGAGWFYWIAGLSLINTVLAFSGGDGGFLIGLGITQIIDGFARGWAESSGGGSAKFVALILDMVVYAGLILLGVMAAKMKLWAFIIGMLGYAIDAAILLVLGLMVGTGIEWLPLGFHALALFFIFKGFAACREYRRLTAA